MLLQGGSINKSINLLQKGYVDVYTDWAKRVDSKWSLEGDFIFPDVFYDKGTTTQPIKFPVDKVWIYDGKTAKLSPSISEFEAYLQTLGWTVEIINNNQNNWIKFKRYANDYASAPLFVKMMRQKSEPNVSDTCNLVIA